MCRQLIHGLIVLILIVDRSPAATLVRLDLVPDGATRPPGDRLDFVFGFLEGETSIKLEIRALVVTGTEIDDVRPIESGDDLYRDAEGNFLAQVTVSRPTDSALLNYQVVVPYSAWQLDNGTYRIGYEVRGIQDGRVSFVRATRMTEVSVTDTARRRSIQTTVVTRVEPEEKTVEAFVMEDGQFVKRNVRVVLPKVTTAIRTAELEVDIPRGFQRSEIDEQARGDVQPARPMAPLDEFEPESKRVIHFATNRKVVDPETKTYERFGNVLDKLTYGACVVNIPVDRHQRGKLELPMVNWWPMRDPKKHFLIDSLSTLAQAAFLDQLGEEDVLMFVHGFSIDFRHAVLRTAQLQHDLEFPGRCVAFSWPSPGKKVDFVSLQFQQAYRDDEERAIGSVPALAEVLESIIVRQQRQGRGKLHVIAHSLGNRVFLNATAHLAKRGRVDMAAQPFGVVVSVAADVDPRKFGHLIGDLVDATQVVNYYYSLEDVALSASKTLHDRTPPAGLAPVFIDGVDTINADNVNSRFFYGLGHSYYASSDPMLSDLKKLFVLRLGPERRQPPLSPVEADAPGKPHWAFALEKK